MMKQSLSALSHLFYPNRCAGCGTVTLEGEPVLCITCQVRLPRTYFEAWPENPVERMFWGRLDLEAASAYVYFKEQGPVQEVMHALKYHGNREAGRWLGQALGDALMGGGRFPKGAVLVPVPIHSSKRRTRGYNQSLVISQGIAERTGWEVLPALTRVSKGPSQTGLGRLSRWQNVSDRFRVLPQTIPAGSHVVLVDDVLTTGATLEACGRCLQTLPIGSLSIATVAFSKG